MLFARIEWYFWKPLNTLEPSMHCLKKVEQNIQFPISLSFQIPVKVQWHSEIFMLFRSNLIIVVVSLIAHVKMLWLFFYIICHNSDVSPPSHNLKYQAKIPLFLLLSTSGNGQSQWIVRTGWSLTPEDSIGTSFRFSSTKISSFSLMHRALNPELQ